jgi:fibronectin type 3 domain-containing protein
VSVRARASLVALAAALVGVPVTLTGCGTALDLEGAARVLRSAEAPKRALLRERPAADLPAPEGLRAVSDELRSVPLKWDPVLVGDVAGYVVERALREKGDFQRVGVVEDRFQTSFVDRGSDLAPKAMPGSAADLGDGATYFYRVRAFDSSGSISSAPSRVGEATTVATPGRPEDLRIYSYQTGKIALTWRPQGDPTVAGYTIYRSPSESGEYLPVGKVDGRYTTTWVDRGLEPLRVFYYRVAAVNLAGGEGVPTASTRGVTRPEPLPPAALRIERQDLGVVRLRFEPNVEPNIAGYRLMRTRAGTENEELAALLAPDETTWEDRTVAAGESVRYRLVAFDRDGLVSEPSVPVAVNAPGYGLEVRAESDGVRLRWSSPADASYASARVLRDDTTGPRELATVRGHEYLDREVDAGARYGYTIVLLGDDGREALPSERVEVTIPAR